MWEREHKLYRESVSVHAEGQCDFQSAKVQHKGICKQNTHPTECLRELRFSQKKHGPVIIKSLPPVGSFPLKLRREGPHVVKP